MTVKQNTFEELGARSSEKSICSSVRGLSAGKLPIRFLPSVPIRYSSILLDSASASNYFTKAWSCDNCLSVAEILPLARS